MRRRSLHRGFTLLEVMIASALGVVVLVVGLAVGLQMQRRVLFEEQTMTAQVTARAVKDLLATDLQRAGTGMGNAAITFANGDSRFAIQVWSDLDLAAGLAPFFAPDAAFSPPPAGDYATFTSDVLQLYWGDTRAMLILDRCSGGSSDPVRVDGTDDYCTPLNPTLDLAPVAGVPTPAILVNAAEQVACHVQVTQLRPADRRLTATQGSALGVTTDAPCGVPDHAIWKPGDNDPLWVAMRTQSAAYRVNWASGIPTLEYQPPGGTWVTVSQDVERMKIRQAVISLAAPNDPYRWFPDVTTGTPAIDRCTMTTCTVDADPLPAGAPGNDAELVRMLQQRVRELEVTLVIRTQRPDRESTLPAGPLNVEDEGFPRDGFKRRTLTFRVTPRNFGAAGRQPIPPAGAGP
ncbi:PilW family protein [Pyxidicoccus xibeiensis]|uniref:PilW family protein n=1 Tax=Pyxidicoccus xibeiensis TaxID=2906759 RepID=UPI0020A71636|nr:prepilin-type N-terminal cleavage/methylation domain-containing protein [Pyxidicoccus xibeiensis]MCP3136547.1 prepilin-type N-terminal cleavage/methylation domain-containing protein [Pyxidicoccus xibeiensis]